MARKKKQINYYEGIPVPDSKEDYLEFMLKEKTRSEAWRETANGYRQWVDNYGYRKGIPFSRFCFGIVGYGAGLAMAGLTWSLIEAEMAGGAAVLLVLGSVLIVAGSVGLSCILKDPTKDE